MSEQDVLKSATGPKAAFFNVATSLVKPTPPLGVWKSLCCVNFFPLSNKKKNAISLGWFSRVKIFWFPPRDGNTNDPNFLVCLFGGSF